MRELPAVIKTSADVDVVGARWSELDERWRAVLLEAEVLEATRVLADATRRRLEIFNEIQALREKYDPLIIKWAKKNLGLLRTVASTFIEVSFRAVSKTAVDLVDEKKGVAYLVKHCPEAVEYVPKVVKAKFTAAFLANVSKMGATALARAGIRVTKPHDSITIALRLRS